MTEGSMPGVGGPGTQTDDHVAARDDEIVYGVEAYAGTVIFAPRGEAERLARFCAVLTSARTWGQVRTILRPDELDEIYGEYAWEDGYLLGDDDRPVTLPDDAPFDRHHIPGYGDGDWPYWPAAEMYRWIPEDVAREFGRIEMPTFGPETLVIDPDRADAAAQRLRELGYACVRDDELISSLNVW